LLTVAGDQVPVMPFVEVVGNVGAIEPEQIGATPAKVGVTAGFTVTVNIVEVAHWPASGVKVYVPLSVLLTKAGDQVPAMPLVDVNGNTGATEPSQIAATGLKVGVTLGVTVTVNVVVVAHWPASGVKV
jgi:subtilisin family serine protease